VPVSVSVSVPDEAIGAGQFFVKGPYWVWNFLPFVEALWRALKDPPTNTAPLCRRVLQGPPECVEDRSIQRKRPAGNPPAVLLVDREVV